MVNLKAVVNKEEFNINHDMVGLKQDTGGVNQDSYNFSNREDIGGEGFALSMIFTGIFIYTQMYEPSSKVFGAFFASAGAFSLYLTGYSPIKITKEIYGCFKR